MGANQSSFILAHAIISLRSRISSIPKSGRFSVVLFYGGSARLLRDYEASPLGQLLPRAVQRRGWVVVGTPRRPW
jgi:hypothetical protein